MVLISSYIINICASGVDKMTLASGIATVMMKLEIAKSTRISRYNRRDSHHYHRKQQRIPGCVSRVHDGPTGFLMYAGALESFQT